MTRSSNPDNSAMTNNKGGQFMPLQPHPTEKAIQAPEEASDNAPTCIDVIVPVYKGLADTQRCILSVLASPCLTPFRLVAINDASPEPEVTAWLRSLQGSDARYLLLENEVNLGFVKTVNRGMALEGEHDVVLLNSDTEVANDWLDRLRNAAYSASRVASVTPFSNNATIFSYPRFCQDNDLPAGYGTARLDRLFAETHAGLTLPVPTGVGFCMFIRRNCLREIGLFDQDHFGKGYGEENDFCCRATDAGWTHLHALDTFVMHAGGVSFGASKSPREQAAMETLRRLHPRYEPAVHRFVSLDPALPYRYALDIARVASSGLPVVLAVTHDRGGGTIRHVGELAQYLREQAIFLALAPAPGSQVVVSLIGPGESLQLAFQLPGEFEDLVVFLQAVGTCHVHYHHLLGHDPLIQQLPSRLNTAFDFTAHDFYAVCPQISLTGKSNGYCGELGPAQCAACLEESPAPGNVSIQVWRDHSARFLTKARYVLAPSRDAGRRMARYLPQATVRFAPHTDIDAESLPAPMPIRRVSADEPLRIVVIGALSPIKGADVLEETATTAARKHAPLEFHLLGFAYRSLRSGRKNALTVHGKYTEADLPQRLAALKPDLVWFPAQWPETYSYTLSACLQAGLPVMGPDIGAFTERLSGRAWSWTRPWNTSADKWVAFFESVRSNCFMSGTKPPAVCSLQENQKTDAEYSHWRYGTDYLHGIRRPANSLQPLTADFLTRHNFESAIGGNHGHRMRRFALTALIWLRSTAVLRNVSRAIPLRWQTRVKSWLRS
ncbi:MAG: glycosyltransferase [Comamonadaceae bacterium]|nr:MAG: glycosyltransferase [Comamonadaceae bacterium]